MFLDVFDLVLPNILSLEYRTNIQRESVFLVMYNANWINNHIFLVMLSP